MPTFGSNQIKLQKRNSLNTIRNIIQNKNTLIQIQVKITELKNVLIVNYFLRTVLKQRISCLKKIGLKNLKIIGKFLKINQKKFLQIY